jgi:prophage regulatory protein
MQDRVDVRLQRVGDQAPVVVTADDRFIGKKELRVLILLTPQHVSKLENAGRFPRRINIGTKRVAWLENEVREWMESRRQNSLMIDDGNVYHAPTCGPVPMAAALIFSNSLDQCSGPKHRKRT